MYHITVLARHDVQFVGVAHVPYATCTHHTPVQSVAQIVHKLTQRTFVAGSLSFIEKLHPVGANVSNKIVSETCTEIFPKLSRNCM